MWYQQIYSYQGILEALSGLAVNVKFISFDDVLEKGMYKAFSSNPDTECSYYPYGNLYFL